MQFWIPESLYSSLIVISLKLDFVNSSECCDTKTAQCSTLSVNCNALRTFSHIIHNQ